MTESAPTDLRERTRRVVRQQISETATQLFIEHGFAATTIEQIAEAAGVSRRSFFRYFPSKEDVILGELVERGPLVADALAARPEDEPPWDALRAALLSLRQSRAQDDRAELEIGRMLYETPTLRARHLEKQLAWESLLVPVLAERIRSTAQNAAIDPELQASAIVSGSLACLDVASKTWILGDGARNLTQLYDEAVAAIRR
ncbi:TetR family transcriptional regulator [Microbacterium faecale]|uniref:TetR family transcriptional regulator n=1 Tax=Microbacterium faecale TaxID=1804630 RepID=A0A916YFU7_9MICO|nr:TetR family transcriptional regulator [Microbacterium faecale]GGD43017.1 TetR family transcriptional regulator [Microbacterium faecale]